MYAIVEWIVTDKKELAWPIFIADPCVSRRKAREQVRTRARLEGTRYKIYKLVEVR